jgi:predicted DNA-binding protein (UPF0251 family)
MDLFDFVYIGAMLIFFVGLWFFYRAACRTDRNLNDELPYKVDAPKTESKSQKRIIITPTELELLRNLDSHLSSTHENSSKETQAQVHQTQ